MPELRPLRAYRYADTDELSQLVAPPYDVIDAALRATLGERSAHNIVHIDLPEGDGDEKYARAAGLLSRWIDQGVLVRDDKPCLLTFEQTFSLPSGGEPITRRGFFGLVRAEPYEAKEVLPHERTLFGPKVDRHKLFVATGAALSPVFLLFDDPGRAVVEPLQSSETLATLTTEDGVHHRLGRIDDPATIAAIREVVEAHPLLIADGHHRYETTVEYGIEMEQSRATEGAAPAPRGAHRYVMAFLCAESEPGLVVLPTHRLIFGQDRFDRATFRSALVRDFEVTELLLEAGAPTLALALENAGRSSSALAAVFPDGELWLLKLRPEALTRPPLSIAPQSLRQTDVFVLHTLVLEGALGIDREQQASQSHLRYYKSTTDALKAIEREEGQVLFLVNRTPVEQVRAACLAGEVMPQKSTFFYPKIPTGLAIHLLDPDEEVMMAGS